MEARKYGQNPFLFKSDNKSALTPDTFHLLCYFCLIPNRNLKLFDFDFGSWFSVVVWLFVD